MRKYISRFHYLTQDLPNRSHIEQVQIACENGANWIQYRCLTKPEDELIEEIHHIASICDDWGATLILTNHYHLLDRVDAQGVHIEDPDADFATIREVITDEKTLGASAYSQEQILALQNTDVVDYCGYGPFASTTTRNHDKPLLGFNGYRELETLRLNIPVIAVGGIKLTDVEPLLSTGTIDGIAVSSAINLAPDMASAVKAFYREIH
ncbi:thiamine phosphate synthase [Mucilaginibacter jinjuensis]|uniref:Thiamine-phosphate synthase n=1 Tax=Mucilaginibacter jinjuensis TaxID=1176721 RepID=A0ABY7TA27_9SPHI|nr:thiamine phosphate synthase [Mucilaginibacter jinjuensis]WCT12593.1 thiamine phosphate synthase [Mucilaginibacter jinjuensis]